MALAMAFALGGCNTNKEAETSPTESVAADPYEKARAGEETSAGIAPPKFTDTSGVSDPMAKDSIKVHIAFQLAANELSSAYINKDAKTYAKYTLPAIVKANGGIESYENKLGMIFNDPGTPSYFKLLSGPLQRTKAKLDDQGYLQGVVLLAASENVPHRSGKNLARCKMDGRTNLGRGQNHLLHRYHQPTPSENRTDHARLTSGTGKITSSQSSQNERGGQGRLFRLYNKIFSYLVVVKRILRRVVFSTFSSSIAAIPVMAWSTKIRPQFSQSTMR